MRIKQLKEGYKVLPAINKERYPEIKGLEGPFRTLNGGVVYYDPKEGSYYDKDRDVYLSYNEFRQMDTDYNGMKDERDEVKEAQIDKMKFVSKGFSNRKEAERQNDQLVGSGKASQKSYVYKHKDNKFYVVDMKDERDEEVELDEISSDLAKRYTKNAEIDRDNTDHILQRDGSRNDWETNQKLHKRNSKRAKGIKRAKKAAELGEALTLDYSRYVRSHGKKPRDTHGGGIWMFTTTDMGEPTEDDMFEFQGSFADAKKAAAKWARSQGAYRFFVMEDNFKKKETELAEAPKSILDDPALQARIARSKEDVAKRKPAMDKALKSIEMTFGPERKAVTDQIGAMTRAADMMTSERWADRALSVVERYGINSKEQLAQEIRIMIDNERELEGHEYIVGADRNVKQLQAALEKLSGLEEGIFNHKDNVIISVMDKNGKPVDRLTARAASSKYRVPVSQILGQTRTQDFAQIGDHYFGVAPVQESSEDPCWDDYKQIGTKKKNGKEVPNCVPKNNKREK